MIRHAIQMAVLIIFWFRKRKFEKQSSFDLRIVFFFEKGICLGQSRHRQLKEQTTYTTES